MKIELTIGQSLMLPNDMSLTIRGLETNYKPWKTVEWKVIEVLHEEKRVIIARLGRARNDYQENIFKKLNSDGHTIVMITHEPDIAEFSKRIITIKDGKIISDKLNKK